MSTRTHFVYRVCDEFGALLYVGCTKQPETRRKQHVAEGRAWVQYARRFAMVGPLERRAAFDLEALVIADEQPYFNVQRDEIGLIGRRNAAEKRAIYDLRCRRQEFLGGIEPESDLWREWLHELAAIAADLDECFPLVDEDERHARYLNDTRRHRLRAA